MCPSLQSYNAGATAAAAAGASCRAPASLQSRCSIRVAEYTRPYRSECLCDFVVHKVTANANVANLFFALFVLALASRAFVAMAQF